jgi:HEAT repeat protein
MSQEPRSKQGSFTLADALTAVSQGDLSHRILTIFSDLDRPKTQEVARAFPGIDAEMRARLIQALDDLNDLSIEYDFNRVFRLGLDDEDAVVKQRSIAALWTDDEPALIERFIVLLNDPSVDVGAEAASALGRFAIRAEEGELPAELSAVMFDHLYALATDPRVPIGISRRALESLGSFSSRLEVPAVILEANESDDQTLRAGALCAMGRSMDIRWFELLMDELVSEDPELRFEAARALGLIGDTRAVEGLAKLASDEDNEVRMAAIEAIGAIGSPGSERVLRRLAERATDEDEINAIIEALEELEALDADRWDRPS